MSFYCHVYLATSSSVNVFIYVFSPLISLPYIYYLISYKPFLCILLYYFILFAYISPQGLSFNNINYLFLQGILLYYLFPVSPFSHIIKESLSTFICSFVYWRNIHRFLLLLNNFLGSFAESYNTFIILFYFILFFSPEYFTLILCIQFWVHTNQHSSLDIFLSPLIFK